LIAGTLLVNNTTGSGTGSGAVRVNGGVLGGTGTISGAVTVNGGSVAPGSSPGILNTGDLDLETRLTFDVQIPNPVSFDQVNVPGSVPINDATLNLTAFGTVVLNSGDRLVIINNDGTDAVQGTLFHGLAEGAILSTNFLGSGLIARITYQGGVNQNS